MSAYQRERDDGTLQWHFRKRVELPDGTSKRISGTPAINTQKAALAAERAAIELLLNPPAPKKERRLMSDVFKEFMSTYVVNANNKESERAQKQSQIDCHLEPALGRLFLDEIDEAKVDELAAKLHATPKARGEGTLGAKTVKNILQTLRKCLRWAKRQKWIDAAPEFEMPRVDEAAIHFLEDVELDALLATAIGEPFWYAAILVAADTGLRQGELRALHWTDINGVSAKLVVSRARWRTIDGTPKSRKPRTVQLTQRAQTALHAIRETKLRGCYVFSNRKGNAIDTKAMNDALARLARAAKLNEIGWHWLRHTFCTRLAMRGVPARTIQELAGHASLVTTMRYMHIAKGAPDDAIALLEDSNWARHGHEANATAEIDSEAGEVIPFNLVTPKGLET